MGGLTGDWLDISAMGELEGIGVHTDDYRIGSPVTFSELVRAPLPPVFDRLKAAREVGGRQPDLSRLAYSWRRR